jgi:hypothetical protein
MELLRAIIIPGVVGLLVIALGLYITSGEKTAEAEEFRRSHGTETARKEAHQA